MVTGKSGMVEEMGTCSGLGTERGPRGWGRGGGSQWMSCWDKNMPKWFRKNGLKGREAMALGEALLSLPRGWSSPEL